MMSADAGDFVVVIAGKEMQVARLLQDLVKVKKDLALSLNSFGDCP